LTKEFTSTTKQQTKEKEQTNMLLKQISVSIATVLMLGSFAYAADTYKVDPAHTSVTFFVRHLGINNVKGQFKEFSGEILMDNGAVTGASGTIQVKISSTLPITRPSRSKQSVLRRMPDKSSWSPISPCAVLPRNCDCLLNFQDLPKTLGEAFASGWKPKQN
jgi:hypothetical protein